MILGSPIRKDVYRAVEIIRSRVFKEKMAIILPMAHEEISLHVSNKPINEKIWI